MLLAAVHMPVLYVLVLQWFSILCEGERGALECRNADQR